MSVISSARARPRSRFRRAAGLAAIGAALLAPLPASAKVGACQAFAQKGIGEARVIQARYDGAVAPGTLAITYVTHSTFVIQTPEGASLATDYAGYAGPGPLPMAVTMNNAHSTHYTSSPSPEIAQVFPGWPAEGEQWRRHDAMVRDLRVRNVHTDVINYTGRRPNGNSIFIFELGDFCVGHLGHLHHVPSEAHFAEIGFLDVVMAPVDGSMTLSHEDMATVLRRLEARLILPMHYFSPQTLERFVAVLSQKFEFEVAVPDSGTLLVSKASLPRKPTLMALPPYLADGFGGD